MYEHVLKHKIPHTYTYKRFGSPPPPKKKVWKLEYRRLYLLEQAFFSLFMGVEVDYLHLMFENGGVEQHGGDITAINTSFLQRRKQMTVFQKQDLEALDLAFFLFFCIREGIMVLPSQRKKQKKQRRKTIRLWKILPFIDLFESPGSIFIRIKQYV